MKKNSIVALVLNIISITCCVIGFFLIPNTITNVFEYYTQDSNVFAAIASLLFVVFLISKKNIEEIPVWVLMLRYISTTCLVVTFLVVAFVLIPMMNNGDLLNTIKISLFSNAMLFHHFLCPIICTISFIFFEGDRRLNKKKTIYFALIPTMIYGTILLVLNIAKIVVGPYPFLMVYAQAWYMVVIWLVVILVGDYLISRFILLWNQQRAPRIKRK